MQKFNRYNYYTFSDNYNYYIYQNYKSFPKIKINNKIIFNVNNNKISSPLIKINNSFMFIWFLNNTFAVDVFMKISNIRLNNIKKIITTNNNGFINYEMNSKSIFIHNYINYNDNYYQKEQIIVLPNLIILPNNHLKIYFKNTDLISIWNKYINNIGIIVCSDIDHIIFDYFNLELDISLFYKNVPNIEYNRTNIVRPISIYYIEMMDMNFNQNSQFHISIRYNSIKLKKFINFMFFTINNDYIPLSIFKNLEIRFNNKSINFENHELDVFSAIEEKTYIQNKQKPGLLLIKNLLFEKKEKDIYNLNLEDILIETLVFNDDSIMFNDDINQYIYFKFDVDMSNLPKNISNINFYMQY